MKLELTKSELDIVVRLMDVGIKATGIQAVQSDLLSVIQKIGAVIQEANKPNEEKTDG